MYSKILNRELPVKVHQPEELCLLVYKTKFRLNYIGFPTFVFGCKWRTTEYTISLMGIKGMGNSVHCSEKAIHMQLHACRGLLRVC